MLILQASRMTVAGTAWHHRTSALAPSLNQCLWRHLLIAIAIKLGSSVTLEFRPRLGLRQCRVASNFSPQAVQIMPTAPSVAGRCGRSQQAEKVRIALIHQLLKLPDEIWLVDVQHF